MKELKLLCIHGIGGKDSQMGNKNGWTNDWEEAFEKMGFTSRININFMKYDEFFKLPDADLTDYWDIFQTSFKQIIFQKSSKNKGLIKRWFDNFPDMVVEFLTDEELRKDLRKELKLYLSKYTPDVIFAHSLGSMICYDFFSQPENNNYNSITLVTAGSQLGNPRLQNFNLKYPLGPLPIKHWYNLNNPKDRVFARFQINLPESSNYDEVITQFVHLPINHNGFEYLTNNNAIEKVWNKIKFNAI